MSVGKMLGIMFIAGFTIMQLIPIQRNNPKTDSSLEIKAATNVKAIFKRSCYDCHSNETKWPWYSNIAPMKWFIARDVDVGRQWLNFSVWESYDEKKKKKLKKMIFTAIELAMPLGMYLQAHPEAKLSTKDRETIRNWTGLTLEDVINNPRGRLY